MQRQHLPAPLHDGTSEAMLLAQHALPAAASRAGHAEHQATISQPRLKTRSVMNEPADARQRAFAFATGALLILVPLLSLPVILHQGPFSQVFLPIWGVLACVADLLTAYLLFGQFGRTLAPAQAMLAATYLYSGLIIVPYMLTFPRIFTPAGLLHAGPQTSAWLWSFWHGGFPLGLLTYAVLDARLHHVVLTARAGRRLFRAVVCLVLLAVCLLTLLTTVYGRMLPALVHGTQFTPLFSATSPLGIGLFALSAAALAALATKVRNVSLVNLWLSVVALACVLDITVNLLVRSRYTVGWYESRLNTVVASVVVLGVLLYEVSRLYAHLAQSEAGLRDLVQRAPVGMSIADEAGIIVLANGAYCAFFGYEPDELVGQHSSVILPPAPPSSALPDITNATTDDAAEPQEWHVVTKTGEARIVLGAEVTVRGTDGFPQRISCIQDITDRKNAELRMEEMAHYDLLTGLPNRTLFNKLLLKELDVARRESRLLALLFIDLDGFKAVNDTLGHGIGDLLLQAVAGKLTECVHPHDSVARLAGDEFVVLLPDIKKTANAVTVAERILRALAQPLTLSSHAVQVSGSVGIGIFPDHAADGESLLRCADVAMYTAKRGGTCRYAMCDQHA